MTLTNTPITVAAPPPINVHRGPSVSPIQPRIGEPRGVPPISTMMYSAMFDEVDEGTAMFKVAASPRDVPADVPLVTLDVDGEHLPSDWYLRLAREAQKALLRVTGAAGR